MNSWADITEEEEAKEQGWTTPVKRVRKPMEERNHYFICKDCKETKNLSVEFIKMMRENGWEYPKRCKKCKV
jgi:hypothetical protein